MQNIKLSKLWVPPRAAPKLQNQSGDSRQVPKRPLPETSESSSQDSSSDNEEALGACGGISSDKLRTASSKPDGESDPTASTSKANVSPPGKMGMMPSSSGAPRAGMPSVRPNAMRNRQKQLEALKRYEDRIKRQMRQEREAALQHAQPPSASSDESDSEFVPTCIQQQRPAHPMYVHVLDYSKAAVEGTVQWLPVTVQANGTAPEETILYSLVHGRGELIMFGGIKTDANTMQMGMNIPPQVVSGTLHFIKAQHQFR